MRDMEQVSFCLVIGVLSHICCVTEHPGEPSSGSPGAGPDPAHSQTECDLIAWFSKKSHGALQSQMDRQLLGTGKPKSRMSYLAS